MCKTIDFVTLVFAISLTPSKPLPQRNALNAITNKYEPFLMSNTIAEKMPFFWHQLMSQITF